MSLNNLFNYYDLNNSFDNKKKIGIFVGGSIDNYSACSYIRLLSPLNSLFSNDYSFYIFDYSSKDFVYNNILKNELNLDLIIIQRDVFDGPLFFDFDFTSLLFKNCNLNNVNIIFDIDDDLLNIDKNHKAYNRYTDLKPILKFIIENSNIITVPNSNLKNKLINLNDSIMVIPNVLVDEWKFQDNEINFRKNLLDSKTIKIGYMGSSTHENDIKLIKDAIKNVNEYFSDKNIVFEIIGGTNNPLDWASRIEIPNNYLPYSKFIKWIKDVINWDIALAPLDNTNINYSKSNLKYLEYTALGVPAVYSFIGPYKKILDRHNGLVVKNSTKNWEAAIINLIEDPDLYSKLLSNSFEDVKNNFLIKNVVNLWENLFNMNFANEKIISVKDNFNIKFNTVLYVLDEKLGFVKDVLTRYNRENFNCFYLVLNDSFLNLFDNKRKIKSWDLKSINYSTYFNILFSINPDIIQINNILKNNEIIIKLAKSMDIPLILESNDFNKIKEFGHYFDKIVVDEHFKNSELASNFNFNFEFINLSIINEFLINLSKVNSNPINILIPGNLIDNYDGAALINLVKNIVGDRVQFHFLGKVPFFLQDSGIIYGEFNKPTFESLITEINPTFIGIFSVFSEIFDAIYLSQFYKVPILTWDDDFIKLFLDDFNGVNFVSDNLSEEFLNDILESNNSVNYYKSLKELYFADKDFKKQMAFLNKLQEDLYFKLIVKKIFTPNNNSMRIENNKSAVFKDFEGFLQESYTSPMFRANFIEEDRRFMSVMENITDYLIKNVSKVENKPLVSVIMPVFNRVDVIQNAIDSVLNQSYKNLELIIVDDGSTDGTIELLKSIDDNRLKLIFKENNTGVSDSRNIGLSVANGEYIAYLDSDDEWDLRFIEAMIGAFIELEDADFIYSAQLLYDTKDSSPFAVRYALFNKSLLNNNNYIGINCFMYKKEIYDKIGGFDTSLNRLVDYDLLLRIKNNFKIYSVPVLLSKVYFNIANNRISTSNINLINAFRCIQYRNKFNVLKNYGHLNHKVNIIIPNFEALKDLQDCINAIKSFNLDNIKVIIVDNNSNGAVKYYLESLKSDDMFRIILNDVNYGFSYAVNQGIEISDNDADILLLNNDAVLTPGSIECMQYYAHNLKDCGMVVPQQVLPGGTDTISVHVPYAVPMFDCDTTPSHFQKNIVNPPVFHNGEILELSFAPFFCAYISRNVLNESNGIDARLGRHYRSDRIFCDYLRNVMKLKIYHVSDAVVYHKLQKATAKLKKDKDSFDIMFLKNEWEDNLAKELGFSKPPWE